MRRINQLMILPQRRYLLHIDDDEDDLNMMDEAVKETDPALHIRRAKNGQEGIELLVQCMLLHDLPALIILDLNMPGMDGRQVLKEIKKHKALMAIPVILFTTSSSEMDKLFARKENVELVTKPSSQSAFTNSVKEILERLNMMKDK